MAKPWHSKTSSTVIGWDKGSRQVWPCGGLGWDFWAWLVNRRKYFRKYFISVALCLWLLAAGITPYLLSDSCFRKNPEQFFILLTAWRNFGSGTNFAPFGTLFWESNKICMEEDQWTCAGWLLPGELVPGLWNYIVWFGFLLLEELGSQCVREKNTIWATGSTFYLEDREMPSRDGQKVL